MAAAPSNDEFNSFFATHYVELAGVVALVTGSRAEAEDLVNEALARAWERNGEVRDLNRWVLTVALNLARNRWRKLRREVLGRPVEDLPAPPAGGISVDLRRALQGLPTRQREVVVLHYLLDISVAEVAGLLGMSSGGVKHALFRARASLAPVLTNEEVG